jgi:TQXA domain-containing protein/LPXTG-motif cell wall-anchored protein
VAALAAATAGLIGAAPAIADGPATAKPVSGTNYGSVRLQDGRANVGEIYLDIEGHRALAYCIDLHHPLATGKEYDEGTWSEAEVDQLAKVQWVLLHGYPTVEPGDLLSAAGVDAGSANRRWLEAVAYTATQVSVWHFSDGAVLTGRGDFKPETYAAIKAVYDYLTSHATDVPEPKATLTITPGSVDTAELGTKAGPFTVAGPSGEITLTATGGQAVDAAGAQLTSVVNAGQFYLVRDTPGEVSVTAHAKATHSTGRVFLFKGEKPRQKLILAGTAGDELNAAAKATFQPPTEHTPSPSPSQSTPSPTPSQTAPGTPTPSATAPGGSGSGGGGRLPTTGAPVAFAIGAGALLMVGGAVALLLVRRRRLRFTA